MTTTSPKLATLFDRRKFLVDRAVHLEELSNTFNGVRFRRYDLLEINGVVSFSEQPISASEQAAFSQLKKLMAEYQKINAQIDKMLEQGVSS